MSSSIFTDKSSEPDEIVLGDAIGKTYGLWKLLRDKVVDKYPDSSMEWYYAGREYGWNFRIKNRQEVIMYLQPCDKYFEVELVFDDKAVAAVKDSKISDEIKQTLVKAEKDAEGRPIRIKVRSDAMLEDLERLVNIKLEH